LKVRFGLRARLAGAACGRGLRARLAGAACGRQAAQALGLQNAVDCVPIEMRQKVGDHEGEIIQREAGCTPQSADDGPLLLGGFPGELMRPARVVLAVGRPALTPLADRLGRDAITLRQDPGWLSRSRNLGPDGRGGAGVRMDRGHQDLLG
jgi:hypothetical protein